MFARQSMMMMRTRMPGLAVTVMQMYAVDGFIIGVLDLKGSQAHAKDSYASTVKLF